MSSWGEGIKYNMIKRYWTGVDYGYYPIIGLFNSQELFSMISCYLYIFIYNIYNIYNYIYLYNIIQSSDSNRFNNKLSLIVGWPTPLKNHGLRHLGSDVLRASTPPWHRRSSRRCAPSWRCRRFRQQISGDVPITAPSIRIWPVMLTKRNVDVTSRNSGRFQQSWWLSLFTRNGEMGSYSSCIQNNDVFNTISRKNTTKEAVFFLNA